jgi:hypothetical protein
MLGQHQALRLRFHRLQQLRPSKALQPLQQRFHKRLWVLLQWLWKDLTIPGQTQPTILSF